MKLSYLVLLFLLSVISGEECGRNCTGGVEDDLFKKPSTYGRWGLAYVRDGGRPPIAAIHPSTLTRAVISIHGNARDAYNYYCYAKNAIEDMNLYDSTYLIAPHFFVALEDSPPVDAFYWVSSASWKEGGRSHQDTTRISSFEILDDVIIALNNRTLFPGLTEIIVVGHSAGGQTAQRYAISTGIENRSILPIRYVIENPGSYAYLDGNRPVLAALPTCATCDPVNTPKKEFTFLPPVITCPGYNNWKAGIEAANVYVNRRNAATIRNEYRQKQVTYVLGTLDTCNSDLGDCGCSDSDLADGCDASVQGYCRLERGVAYYQHLQAHYNFPSPRVHSLAFVPGVGHNGCEMLRSSSSLQAMFPGVPFPTNAPTDPPTQPPTSPPTNAPTDAPTFAPTNAPTPSPAPDICASSVSVTQTRVNSWSSEAQNYSQWTVFVSNTFLPIYDIHFSLSVPIGVTLENIWQVENITGSNLFRIKDWRLQSGAPVPAACKLGIPCFPNTQISFGYIVSGQISAQISIARAQCTPPPPECLVNVSLALENSSVSSCNMLVQDYSFSLSNVGAKVAKSVTMLVKFPAMSYVSRTSGLTSSHSASQIVAFGQTTFTVPLSLVSGAAVAEFTIEVPTVHNLLPNYGSAPTYEITSTTC